MHENDNDAPLQIIKLSAEASALLRNQYELDRAEAGQKLPVDSFCYRGVTLDSRFSVAGEFQQMKAVVDVMPDLVRGRIESIWCDSRACADYTVTVAAKRWAEGIEWDIRHAFLSATEGFNGLAIEGGDRHARFDPVWLGDDDMDPVRPDDFPDQ